MDVFVDAVHWHGCAFLATASGNYWRVFFDNELGIVFIEMLTGSEPEWHEPLSELKRRRKVYWVEE